MQFYLGHSVVSVPGNNQCKHVGAPVPKSRQETARTTTQVGGQSTSVGDDQLQDLASLQQSSFNNTMTYGTYIGLAEQTGRCPAETASSELHYAARTLRPAPFQSVTSNNIRLCQFRPILDKTLHNRR